jgi:hypothetical protein
MLSDFDEDMLSLAIGYWMLGVSNEADLAQAQAMFSLLYTALRYPRYFNAPTRQGDRVLAVLNVKDCYHEQLLCNALSPVKL